jgi:hypothetical protein
LRSEGVELRGNEGDFRVMGAEGPLKEGEIARARQWALSLTEKVPPDRPERLHTP